MVHVRHRSAAHECIWRYTSDRPIRAADVSRRTNLQASHYLAQLQFGRRTPTQHRGPNRRLLLSVNGAKTDITARVRAYYVVTTVRTRRSCRRVGLLLVCREGNALH